MTNLPVPSPRTFTVGETETAAFLNSLRDALNFLLNRPRARLSQTSAATSTPNSTWTAIGLDTFSIDTYGGHSNVTNNTRYTAVVAGRYRCAGSVVWVTNATSQRYARIQVNGTPTQGSGGSSIAVTGNASQAWALATVFLNVGDYVEVAGFQSSGGALNTSPATGEFGPSLDVIWEATS